MKYDLWFSRYEDGLVFVVAPEGTEPDGQPFETSSVKHVKDSLTAAGHEIVQTGILPAEYLGLE